MDYISNNIVSPVGGFLTAQWHNAGPFFANNAHNAKLYIQNFQITRINSAATAIFLFVGVGCWKYLNWLEEKFAPTNKSFQTFSSAAHFGFAYFAANYAISTFISTSVALSPWGLVALTIASVALRYFVKIRNPNTKEDKLILDENQFNLLNNPDQNKNVIQDLDNKTQPSLNQQNPVANIEETQTMAQIPIVQVDQQNTVPNPQPIEGHPGEIPHGIEEPQVEFHLAVQQNPVPNLPVPNPRVANPPVPNPPLANPLLANLQPIEGHRDAVLIEGHRDAVLIPLQQNAVQIPVPNHQQNQNNAEGVV